MTKKREKPLHLDLSFDEALRRYVRTDPPEIAKRPKQKTKAYKAAADITKFRAAEANGFLRSVPSFYDFY
jgi:hypothetical protein